MLHMQRDGEDISMYDIRKKNPNPHHLLREKYAL